jgi:CheY-like chemotaxis protein
MDGMSSTRAIRQFEDLHNIPRSQIVALTGLASASARLEALSSGVDKFITKPLNFKVLASLLEESDEKRRQSNEMRELRRGSKTEDVENTTNGTHEMKEAKLQQGDGKVEPDLSVKQPGSQQDVPKITINGTYETNEAERDLSVKQPGSTELEQKPDQTQEEGDPANIQDHENSKEVKPQAQDVTSESHQEAMEEEAHHETDETRLHDEVTKETNQQGVKHEVEGRELGKGVAQQKVEQKETPPETQNGGPHHEIEPRAQPEPEKVKRDQESSNTKTSDHHLE